MEGRGLMFAGGLQNVQVVISATSVSYSRSNAFYLPHADYNGPKNTAFDSAPQACDGVLQALLTAQQRCWRENWRQFNADFTPAR